MTVPAVAFHRFLTGLALGCALGILYGFLRPVRRGRAVIPDLVFAAVAGWVYLYYGFAVCRGDLRMGYMAALAVGALAWDRVFGRGLLPIYRGFWAQIGKFLRGIEKIVKKFLKIVKFFFASGKKWGTIK